MTLTALTGTYSVKYNGAVRTLSMTVDASGAINATWHSTIMGNPAYFHMTGHAVENPVNQRTLFFSMHGISSAHNTSKKKPNPQILYAANAIAGSAQVIKTAKKGLTAPKLHLTVAWGEDGPGLAEDSNAWVLYLDKQ